MTASKIWIDAVPSADLVSAIIHAKEATIGNLQVKWTGLDAADGVFTLESTNFDPSGSDWFPVATKTASVTPADKWEARFDNKSFSALYYRVRFTKNSVTTGTINAVMVTKNK